MFFNKLDRNGMSRTDITLNFKRQWFLNQAHYWAEKLKTDLSLDPLMPCEDKNFRGSFVLDFGIWWRHVKTVYREIQRDAWLVPHLCHPPKKSEVSLRDGHQANLLALRMISAGCENKGRAVVVVRVVAVVSRKPLVFTAGRKHPQSQQICLVPVP